MKYVIEIKPEYEDTTRGIMVLGAKDSNLFVDTLAVENLEELNSDYINEHFGSLQDDAYKRGYDKGYADKTNFDEVSKELAKDIYQRGLDDAWAAAKKVVLNPDEGGLDVQGLGDVFSCATIQQVFRRYTLSEVLAKLKTYEKKQSDKIVAGDEVVSKHSGIKGILLEPETEDVLATIIVPSQRWRTIHNAHENLKKTGKHYDIEKLLEAMKA